MSSLSNKRGFSALSVETGDDSPIGTLVPRNSDSLLEEFKENLRRDEDKLLLQEIIDNLSTEKPIEISIDDAKTKPYYKEKSTRYPSTLLRVDSIELPGIRDLVSTRESCAKSRKYWFKAYKFPIIGRDADTIVSSFKHFFAKEIYFQKKAFSIMGECGFVTPEIYDYGYYSDGNYVVFYIQMENILQCKYRPMTHEDFRNNHSRIHAIIKQLDSHNITHGDINKNNIFISKDDAKELCLIDWGNANIIVTESNKRRGGKRRKTKKYKSIHRRRCQTKKGTKCFPPLPTPVYTHAFLSQPYLKRGS
jgi:hypothetical protein